MIDIMPFVAAGAVLAAWHSARMYFANEANKMADNTAMARLERKFYEHETKTALAIENVANGMNKKFVEIDDRLGGNDLSSYINRKQRGA